MGKKITYLIGAGASANIIPVVGQMYPRLQEIVSWLNEFYSEKVYNRDIAEHSRLLGEIIADLQWLIKESGNYFTVDTLAKKFFLTNRQNEYERLKKSLILYFTIEQSILIPESPLFGYSFIKNPIDKRYDSFIAAISQLTPDGIKLNSDISILSWNYDIQLELSLKRFTNRSIIDIKRGFNIFPLLNEQELSKHTSWSDEFSMRKLNGSAIFSTDSRGESTIYDYYYTDNILSEDPVLQLRTFLQEVARFDFRDNVAARFFNFAWEVDQSFKGRKYTDHEQNLIEAEKLANQTDILVVIGYSFPIFNREIDNRIFNKMHELKKVYIQDVYPEKIKSTMINAFKKLQETNVDGYPVINFQEDTSLDQFVIPFELHNE